MNRDERRGLLEDLKGLTLREDENLNAEDKRKRFLPLTVHRLALRPETVVIQGGRGAGKSALFGLLQTFETSKDIRAFFDDDRLPEARWVDAFSEHGTEHPQTDVLADFASSHNDFALRTVWLVHLLKRLADKDEQLALAVPQDLRRAWQRGVAQVDSWYGVASSQLGQVHAVLDRFERRLAESRQYFFATYDHLDKIGILNRDVRRRYVSALLALWLSLANRYSQLRGKIFLREDLFREAIQSFPDATKLRPRSVSLDWDVASLYRVVLRHLANTSDAMRDWLSRIRGLELLDRGPYGRMPGETPDEVQKAFASRFAGELMGKGVRKGYTYRWIPNRLQDAQVKIVPRSILCLFGFAGQSASNRPLSRGDRLVTPADLLEALGPTSRERVSEIKEEFPIVERLENLRGKHVLMDRKEAEGLLAKRVTSDELPGVDGSTALEELVDLGVLRIRDDGRVDVPDIYRYGFGIKRRGGVARPR